MVKRGPQLVQLMKGIAIAPVGRIEHLAQAVVADGDVRRDQRLYRLAAMCGDDLEVMVPVAGNLTNTDVCYTRERWRFSRQMREKVVHRALRTLNLNADAGGGVADASSQLPLAG